MKPSKQNPGIKAPIFEFRLRDDEGGTDYFSLEFLLPQIERFAKSSPLMAAKIKTAVRRGECDRRDNAKMHPVPGRPRKSDDEFARVLALTDDAMVRALTSRAPTSDQQIIRKAFGFSEALARTTAQKIIAEMSGVHHSTVQRSARRLAKKVAKI